MSEQSVSVGGFSGTPAQVGDGSSGAVALETNGAPQTRTAEQDAIGFEQFARDMAAANAKPAQSGEPAINVAGLGALPESQVKQIAREWMDSVRADYVAGKLSPRQVQLFRASNMWIHSADAPVPPQIAEAFARQQNADKRVEAGDLTDASWQKMSEADMERTAQRVRNIPGLQADDGSYLTELGGALGLASDTVVDIAKRFAQHTSELGNIHALDEAGHAEFYGEACRQFGGEDKFLAASQEARAVLAKLPSPSPKYRSALEWVDGTGISKSSLVYDGFVVNMIRSHGRFTGQG